MKKAPAPQVSDAAEMMYFEVYPLRVCKTSFFFSGLYGCYSTPNSYISSSIYIVCTTVCGEREDTLYFCQGLVCSVGVASKAHPGDLSFGRYFNPDQ